jgi:hypothetical protein
MRSHRRLHSSTLIGSALMLATLGCGGGGGGGDSFLVSGLWSVNATGAPTAGAGENPICGTVAAQQGGIGSTQINVVQAGNTVAGTEVGSGLAFTGTVNTPAQSFTLDTTTPICSQQGACQVCGALATDFLNAAGNSADVNITIGATGNAACPVQCTLTFPPTTATRS